LWAGVPAAGAAGIGAATEAARTAARIVLPSCFTVGSPELRTQSAEHFRIVVFYPKKSLRVNPLVPFPCKY
jgi:hypothetical protein